MDLENMEENIALNSNFDNGLSGWFGNSCTASMSDNFFHLGGKRKPCAIISNRKDSWQGLEQDITARLKVNMKYNVQAMVGIASSLQSKADVRATLRLEDSGFPTRYVFVGRVQACGAKWENLQGSFCVDTVPQRAVFYLEGPPAGVDLLVYNVEIKRSNALKGCKQAGQETEQTSLVAKQTDLLQNPEFEEGLLYWLGKGCKLCLHESLQNGKVLPVNGTYFVAATKRTSGWQGIEQEVTGRLKERTKYRVLATVRICGDISSTQVQATLWIKTVDLQEYYISLGRVKATTTNWVQLNGSMVLNSIPKKAIAYIEGPPSGIDLLIDSFSITLDVKPPCIAPTIDDPKFGVNMIVNSNFINGLAGWYALGSCSLALATGGPCMLPPTTACTLVLQLPISGHYVKVTNRKHYWEGPAQTLTEKLQLFLSYQVSGWVRVGYGGNGPQKVNVALGVDGQWMNGGEVEGNPDCWTEIVGSFRLEKKPSKVIVYVQGPSSDVDLMVAGLQIFAIDRMARFPVLKAQTDKIRKRDVVLKLNGQDGHPFSHVSLRVEQTKNLFPIGSCINEYSLRNESYVKFFLDHFNWAVFENEMKWGWTEQQPGKLNYRQADILCDFCIQHGIPARGHCIFWETENAVQDWIKNLCDDDLAAAVRIRIVDLVSRYNGKFKHYDVNNEMLHGSFYKDRLGSTILADMFKMTHQVDSSATLFVNDYHIEDGCDANSSPEKFIHQIRDLQAQGAPVGGIGLQGHLNTPIGAIICSALDKLALVGLPIWFTEVDVASINEYTRGEDLEVILREAFAHPAVEGIMLWGFFEAAMHREQGHLVDADGTINEAGKKFLALKNEWTSNFEGCTDKMGQFKFSGFHGTYTLTLNTNKGRVQKTFEVGKGEGFLTVEMQV